MKNIEDITIESHVTIKGAIKKLDETARKILIITKDEKFLGVITDGDIRRWILKNGNLEEEISAITNTQPHVLKYKDLNTSKKLMRKHKIEAIPIINDENKCVDIVFWEDTFEDLFIQHNKINTPIVIMAGGKGKRLYPYTQILPKPLIPIGEKSIIEHIIENFTLCGGNKFYLTLNYKKNMIKAYFDEIDKNYEVVYIEEEKFLGTGGSLYLLKNRITETFFVSNCDILVQADYADIIKYHKENRNKITMVTSLKNYTIPYGVIEINNEGSINSILEKPNYNFQVNTGLYVLEPSVLEDIAENTYLDLTDLINNYVSKGYKVGAYPVTENAWMDMGEIKEMEEMIKKIGV